MAAGSKTVCGTSITLCRGDITQQNVEAIVNAAKNSLMGGGGVDGAIHRAGGPAILEECKQIKALQGGCPTGGAVITGGGRLQAQYVIHTVGPIWRHRQDAAGGNEAELLASCYKSSLQLALDYNLRTVAFPSISTGAYGYPIDKAAPVALNAVAEFIRGNQCLEQNEPEGKGEGPEGAQANLTEVRFVLYDPTTLAAYQTALDKLDCN